MESQETGQGLATWMASSGWRLTSLGRGPTRSGSRQTLHREPDVFRIEIDAREPPSQTPRHDRGRPRSKERIDDEIPRLAAGEENALDEPLGFLRRMGRVLAHRPEGNAEVDPDVRRMGQAMSALGRLVPILGAALRVAIRSDHFLLHLHGAEVERVAVAHGREPDVLVIV